MGGGSHFSTGMSLGQRGGGLTHKNCYSNREFNPVIYGADKNDDWTNPKVWKKANPSLGITVSIDKVQAACESAKQNPGEENAFRQFRLNQWVKQAVRWMPMDKWDACAFPANEDRRCYCNHHGTGQGDKMWK